MALFEFGKEKLRKSTRENRVDVAPLDGYRYANWDPYTLLQDIRHAGLEAGSQEKHIWVTSESLQMDAASAWLSAVRQSTGHMLIDTNKVDDKIPKDVADMATVNYKNAQYWIDQREAIKASDEPYTLDDTPSNMTVSWPQSGQQVISPELFTSVYTMAGQLITISLPIVLETLDISLPYPPEYRGYDQELMRKLKNIQQRLLQLDMAWNNHLNPNTAPGDQVYRDAVMLFEDIVKFGVESLVPVLGNSFYKLKPIVPRPEEDKNAFSPATFRPPREVKTPQIPPFSAADLRSRIAVPSPELTTPVAPPLTTPTQPEPFDARKFGKSTTPEAATDDEAFSPTEYLQRYLGNRAISPVESTAFDPAAHRAPRTTSDEDEQGGDAFDPTKYTQR